MGENSHHPVTSAYVAKRRGILIAFQGEPGCIIIKNRLLLAHLSLTITFYPNMHP